MAAQAVSGRMSYPTLQRHLALGGVLFFCFAAILVHIVRDDLSIWSRTLSIYAVGPAGWVLTLGFFSLPARSF